MSYQHPGDRWRNRDATVPATPRGWKAPVVEVAAEDANQQAEWDEAERAERVRVDAATPREVL